MQQWYVPEATLVLKTAGDPLAVLAAAQAAIHEFVALLLTSIGLYAVMAWSVALRRPEIGMRVALGASRRDIVRLILGQGVRIAVLGLLLGPGLAMAVTRMLAGLLVGVTPTDAVSYVLTVVVLALVAGRRAQRAGSAPVLESSRTVR